MVPENYEPKRFHVIISVIILSAFSVYTIKTIIEREEAFASGARFTIGYTTEFYMTTSGRHIKYSYWVNGVEYVGSASYGYNSKVPGGRYWVKFSVKNPEISKIYQNKPVTIDIKTVPPDGVKSITSSETFLLLRFSRRGL